MAIGRTFTESMQKALLSLEIGALGFGGGKFGGDELPDESTIKSKLGQPNADVHKYLRVLLSVMGGFAFPL